MKLKSMLEAKAGIIGKEMPESPSNFDTTIHQEERKMLAIFASILFSLEGTNLGSSLLTRIAYALLCSNGGGFIIRDLLLLRRTPSLLSNPLEMFICIFTACAGIGSYLPSDYLPLLDLIGIEVYVYDTLFQSGQPPFICILCGFFSGVGGGIIAGLLHGDIKHIRDLVTPNRVFALIVSILMYSRRGPVFILPVFFAMLNSDFRNALRKKVVAIIDRCRFNDVIWKGTVITFMPKFA